MTISTTIGAQLTINRIVEQAYKYSGLLHISGSPSPTEYSYGRELLENIMDALESDSYVQARAIGFHVLTLVSGTGTYVLPATILELLGTAMLIQGDNETVMTEQTPRDFQLNPNKASPGQPFLFYQDRQLDAGISVTLWPIPDDSSDTIRFTVQRKFADVEDGNATIDLQNYWVQHVKVELARQLAETSSLPTEKVMRLMGEAQRTLMEAKRKSKGHHGTRLIMAHRGMRYGRY